jgi:hypothetical protein
VKGRAEYKKENQWGTICNEGFNNITADIFCKFLSPISYFVNWTTAGPYLYRPRTYIINGVVKPIFMSNVSCFGNETSLDQCKYNKRCMHSEDVVITC